MKQSEAVKILENIMILHQKARSSIREGISGLSPSSEATERFLNDLSPLEQYLVPAVTKMLDIASKGGKIEPTSFMNIIYILETQCQPTLLLAAMNNIRIPAWSPRIAMPWEPEC